MNQKGAIAEILECRVTASRMAAELERVKKAVTELKNLGVTTAEKLTSHPDIPYHPYYEEAYTVFALMVYNSPTLKDLLVLARDKNIPILLINDGESCISGKTILINHNDTPEKIIEFLGGHDRANQEREVGK